MFVIWRGYGVLIIVAAVVGGIAAGVLAIALDSAGLKISDLFIPVLIGIGASALCYGTTVLLERSDKGRAVIDKKTGQELLLRRGDSLFFIPVRWWTYALIAVTTIYLVVAIVKSISGT